MYGDGAGGKIRIDLPAMTMKYKTDVARFVARHQEPDDHVFIGIGLQYGGCRISVDGGIKNLIDGRYSL